MLIKTDDNPTNLGYWLIDQRACGQNVDGTSTPIFECATYTCSHCTAVVVLNPERKRPRYKCWGCSHLICDQCAAIKAANGGQCDTIMAKYERHLASLLGGGEPDSSNPPGA